MHRRVFVILVLALCIAAVPRAALAHFPEVQGTEDCSGHLSYTVTAWNGPTPESRTNPDIGVTVNGKDVQHGSFSPANGFSFTGSVELGTPQTAHVKVTALAPWGNGAAAGQSRSATVKAPSDCETATTRTTTPTGVAPSSSLAPTTAPPAGVAPSSTIAGRLPFTGRSAVPMLVVGLLLVAGGAASVASGRRGASGPTGG
jgi:hypothetical protein